MYNIIRTFDETIKYYNKVWQLCNTYTLQYTVYNSGKPIYMQLTSPEKQYSKLLLIYWLLSSWNT